MKKYRHREVTEHVFEYDYAFHWPPGTICPYNLNDLSQTIESPVKDGNGVVHNFRPEFAMPVRVDSGSDGVTIYVETFEPIT
jgi:hypothetical protein